VVNGVSQRHGEIVTRDWRHLIGHDAEAVTNGVHTPTWISRELALDVSGVAGPNWPLQAIRDDHLFDLGSLLGSEAIWRSHMTRKEILSGFVRNRIRLNLARNGASPDELRAVEDLLPADRLTLGFARRFATYKRATLLFVDKDRLRRILTNPARPIQIVFAGKAHPADQHGQNLIRELAELSKTPEFRGHVFMVEDYDARVAKFLVQGTDVWMNNPRPPMEASGTSGMKAAINGVLNCSVLDGWWIEGYNGMNGWAFGKPQGGSDWGKDDKEDSEALYSLLEDEIAPLYYDRNELGIPTAWVERMRQSMASSVGAFSSHRMVADYCRLAYFPLGSSA
jgi:starch phosphorylase